MRETLQSQKTRHHPIASFIYQQQNRAITQYKYTEILQGKAPPNPLLQRTLH